jgi:uncharacterized SAM-binding protein YcdF (DUF218 family)
VNRIGFRSLWRVGERVAALLGVLLLVVFYTPVTDWIAGPLFINPNPTNADAIVVLASWANARGELNEPGLRRAIAAGRLYRAGLARTVVITGDRPNLSREDAGDSLDASAKLLQELGVPPSAIVLEDHSGNTRESAINIAAMARQRGWGRLVLVTDATHMRRTRAVFAHQGLSVSCEPTMMWRIGGNGASNRLAKLGAVVHEYGGLAYYRARGWI